MTSIGEKKISKKVRLIHAEQFFYRISSFYEKRKDTAED